MTKLKLAEALLRRKELEGKVALLRNIKDRDLFEVKVRRQNVTESVDEVVAQVPKLTASQLTAELDYTARRLRLIDSAIQQANWTTEIEVSPMVLAEYEPEKI